MTLDQLRREQTIQAHHWQAAKWFVDQILCGSAAVAQIRHDCRQLEVSSACYGLDSFALLTRAAVARETLQHSEKIIGVLRETLNVVDRVKRREGRLH